ncbi:GTP-binding protein BRASSINAZOLE INSENSITIVE PALE GREEN 2, chloroplastic-like [Chenopodium quinoa]|uniref:GTP-binding protein BRASSINAZOLE INSENSITIVE PALE GREEN 2, chloroplastic-like n=1 Tax=Chenopodium quinoa TaxID=63459 RepID=UPI000B7968EC|nr:GTP-binding protein BRASSINAZOLE INSENSITIVE PALE GREEN 2, chloroplastic-like [Chenopodium quinoa]
MSQPQLPQHQKKIKIEPRPNLAILTQKISSCKSPNLQYMLPTASATNAACNHPTQTQALLFFREQNACHENLDYYKKIIKNYSSNSVQNPSLKLIREGNFDDIVSQTLQICPGCGVHMQNLDPNLPGFYVTPATKNPDYKLPISRKFVLDEPEVSDSLKRGVLNEFEETQNPPLNPNLCEKPVVCARCHSLRHYGKVKDVSLENLLPDFDFDHTVGRKLATASGGRSVVLMVVDVCDFDGTFPKKVAKLVSATIDENVMAWKEGKSGNVPRMVLVLSKLDLLPSSLSPTRLEHWIRQRAREGGANKLTSVHMVSAVRDWGVKNLIDDVVRLVGPRGNVWAIGAQNAGKSTLINAIGKHVTGKVAPITEAPVPGTTLGIIKLEGIFPGKAKLLDTPGLLHPHHIATRLTRDEQKLVQINKELKPRTYRIKVGHTIHIAGIARLDIEELAADSVYVTVWASPLLPLHMGKTENADRMLTDHFGRQLQPPIGENRHKELGGWVKRDFQIRGNSWDSSAVDIAVAGVGWFAICIKGEATICAWTYDGIDVVLRNSLLPQRAQQFEVAGFSVSKLVAEADKTSNKLKNQGKEGKRKNSLL